MADPTYKRIDIVGTSSKGTDDAIQNGIAKATETIHDVDWFEVIEIRGRIENGKIASWQADMRIGFKLD